MAAVVRTSAAALEAQAVYKVFVARRGGQPEGFLALRNVGLDVRRGEFLTLIGPSGCGKSTLLNMFAGLVQPTTGSVRHDGTPITGVNTRVGYITQDDNLLPWRTMLGNVELSLEFKGMPSHERRERALRYLRRVGLGGFEDHYPHELSGGMRKRVSIVRTLVDEADDVVLMDEPFGALDAQTRLLLQDWLLRLWEGSDRTIVFVTHDLVEAIAMSDRIAVFTRTPGSIKAVRQVPIVRPRDVFHMHEAEGFRQIYQEIWEDLAQEINQTDSERTADGQ